MLAAVLICGLGFLLQLGPTVFYPSISHPDEIFQSLEQAHRIVFGYGAIPWEYEFGARSWLLPGLLSAPMAMAAKLGPAGYLAAVHVMLAASAATVAFFVYSWAKPYFGGAPAALAALLIAVWPDAVYYGARSLSECAAAPLLVTSLYLIAQGRDGRRLAAAGMLLGLAVALRIQVAPAAIVALPWAAASLRRRSVPLFAGFIACVVAVGLLDALTWSYPFESFWRYVAFNAGGSASYGVAPWYAYGTFLFATWGWTLALLLPLILLGARRAPLPFFCALAVLVAHSLIPHKEARFIYPAVLLLIAVAGMGLAEIAAPLSKRQPRIAIVAGTAAILAVSASLAATPPYVALWRGGHDMVRANLFTAGLNGICGIGMIGTYGGASYVHQRVPLFWPLNAADLAKDAEGFNTAIVRGAMPLAGYHIARCFGDICVAQRAGTCRPMPMPELPRPAALTGHPPFPQEVPSSSSGL